MPHNRFLDFLGMGRKPVADRGPNEVGTVGIEAFLHQQIDVAKVDVAEVDRDLFRLARSVAESVNLGGHQCPPPSIWMVYGWLMLSFKWVPPGTAQPGGESLGPGRPTAAFFWVPFPGTAPRRWLNRQPPPPQPPP